MQNLPGVSIAVCIVCEHKRQDRLQLRHDFYDVQFCNPNAAYVAC